MAGLSRRKGLRAENGGKHRRAATRMRVAVPVVRMADIAGCAEGYRRCVQSPMVSMRVKPPIRKTIALPERRLDYRIIRKVLELIADAVGRAGESRAHAASDRGAVPAKIAHSRAHRR
jgi:hypothetical protein